MPIILKEKPQPPAPSKPAGMVQRNQQRRLLIAVALLLAALVIVLLKRSQSPASSQTETPAAEPAAISTAAATPQALPVQPASVPSPLAQKEKKRAKNSAPPAITPEPPPAGPMITATNRTVLPPLEVEVVAGNQHRSLPPSNNSVKVEMNSSPEPAMPAAPQEIPDTTPVPSATTEVTIPPATAQRVTRSVEPTYPVLARQMKVQGSVVLQAVIDKSGNIEELHVISGPSILASAAQQALRQWHFKPYYAGGQPVETEARVTVNFTISTY